ncbi:hypothetical protein DNTS_020208 [Danionella cerebrum]|uniref:Uncharacterized protein n=1 Tax=Danionella cerebrum TaxID=2873325 RepID=A0A553N9Y5_9TELE|nr:hypothetical protein DNTS_020208 [Danionella translucida]
MALPKMRTDDPSEQDRLVTEDEMSETGSREQTTFRKRPIIEGRLMDEDGTKRIFILADKGIQASLENKGNRVFSNAFPELLQHVRDNAVDGFTMEKRLTLDDGVGKREIDMLRCMIGRVYRPCWKA